jgi:hypothetical protein
LDGSWLGIPIIRKRHTPTQFGESILGKLAQDLSKETNKERKIVIITIIGLHL